MTWRRKILSESKVGVDKNQEEPEVESNNRVVTDKHAWAKEQEQCYEKEGSKMPKHTKLTMEHGLVATSKEI